MQIDLWEQVLADLEIEYSEQDLNTWIRPLYTQVKKNSLTLLAPNEFIVEWVQENYLSYIQKLTKAITKNNEFQVTLKVGSSDSEEEVFSKKEVQSSQSQNLFKHTHYLNEHFRFNQFVQGRSNEFALSAAIHVSKQPGGSYNPLLIYGGVGLGKTHLMQGIGHDILDKNSKARVLYIHAERFVADMIKALQRNAIEEFKEYYRSLDVLLIDDVQFFVGKERSQQEFFHTFNTLLENKSQIVLTCDRYPKEIAVEKRLRSRFEWGLTVAVEPPELETRVAILMKKAESLQINLPYESAFFIAQQVCSNVRELEGALKRVVANAQFKGVDITLDLVKEALRDLITVQNKQVSLDNIQKVVADFYKIKVNDLLSKTRLRSIARPRQMAMMLAKELTDKSYPEIGDSFGGRDHTTVLYACTKMKELTDQKIDIQEDYLMLVRMLTE